MGFNPKTNILRYTIKIFGIVQGVGYRPYIYNQAIIFNIKGWVSNKGSSVIMDIEGLKKDIKEFLLQVVKKSPSLASIEKVEAVPGYLIGYTSFHIEPSSVDEMGLKFIGMDVAICQECLNEIFDPKNSRYQYAFTNCTACGPRYSIINELPYDRKNTTMANFQLCANCEKEYNDPTNRRFHAQPNCCPNCGPTLQLLNNEGQVIISKEPIKKVIALLKDGFIVAIKGLGGFHLACDAQNHSAVKVLRERKNRPHKPFGIMVKNIEVAKRLCFINELEETILLSNKRPIVLLEKKENNNLSHQIAPNSRKLGIMLPYTPLHYLLFQDDITCLVMTSGNMSSAPIQYDNLQAIKYLGTIADYFLIHNRNIHIPLEDSVVKVVNNHEVVIRRARGYTPFVLPMKSNNEVLALGAEEKSTFCFAQNQYLYMSQYLGDLKNYDTYINYENAIINLTNLFNFKPKLIAHDLNKSYFSSKYEIDKKSRKLAVQHHHAHMVSCMVEHNIFCNTIGVIFDGTGLGTDEKIWGGEFFIGTRENFIRVGQFKYVTIQGGDQAIREPWRIAFCYLQTINYDHNYDFNDIDKNKLSIIKQALDKNLNCYETSSVGRLFDCVSALLNICTNITYDAQAAIELENILAPSIIDDYPYYIEEVNQIDQIDYKNILICILEDIKKGLSTSCISAKFHNTIGRATVDMVMRISKKYGIKNVVLSGGVFENNYLLNYIIENLNDKEFKVYYNQQIPTNDSGVSVGQLAIVDSIEGVGRNVYCSTW